MTTGERNRAARSRVAEHRKEVVLEALRDTARLRRWKELGKRSEGGEKLLSLARTLLGITRVPLVPDGWRLILYWLEDEVTAAIHTLPPTLPPGTITYQLGDGGVALALGQWGEVDPKWAQEQWGIAFIHDEDEGTGTLTLKPEGQEGRAFSIGNLREVLYSPTGRPWLPMTEEEAERFILRGLEGTRATPEGLSALAEVVEGMPRPLEGRHLAVVERRRPGDVPPQRFSRSPALLSLIGLPLEQDLSVIEVDGEPLVSAGPRATPKRVTYRPKRRPAEQGTFWSAPKTLSGEQIDDVLIVAVASEPLTGDERSSLRGDLVRLGRLAYALSGPTRFSEQAGALLLTGNTTAAAVERWWVTTEVARWLTITINPHTREWREYMDVRTLGGVRAGGEVVLGPSTWWKGRGRASAWRLSGGLWRPAQLGRDVPRGTALGYWDDLHRTIDGLEAALSWGPSAGRGRDARIPNNLRPETLGGPGPEVFVPWQLVLTLAGEHIPPDTRPRSAEGQRYRDRIRRLEETGYVANGRSGTAPAGDTIEIVEVVDGNSARTLRLEGPGIHVRASARFCAAVKSAQRHRSWTLVPVGRLLKKYLELPRKVP